MNGGFPSQRSSNAEMFPFVTSSCVCPHRFVVPHMCNATSLSSQVTIISLFSVCILNVLTRQLLLGDPNIYLKILVV